MKEKFSRWELLYLQYMKRDWKKIIIWVLGVGLFSSGFVPAFEEIAKGQGLSGMYETLLNPAMIAMVGPTPVESAEAYTLGAMYAHEMLLFCGLFSMIISMLHVIGHTRKEEDLGLTEMVRSFRVGRQANSLAVMIEVITINIILTLLISIIMVSFNADTITVKGAVMFGLSVGVAGIIGAVIALVVAQLMSSSSSATGVSLGIVGLMYIIRAGTDSTNVDYSMFNPMGWTYLTYPFTENNGAPIIFSLIFGIIMLSIAFVLEGRRDMGAGYIPERSGRSMARSTLLSVPGLLLRTNRSVIISWFIGFTVMGAAYGSIYGEMQSFLESNELMQEMFSSAGATIEASFTGTIMAVMIGLVAILPIALINKLFTEETRLHLSQLFATKVTRGKLFWSAVCISIGAGVIGILLSVIGLGGAALQGLGSDSSMDMGDFLSAGFNFLPVVLFFTGLSSLLLGWAPKLGKIVYLYLAYSFFLNYFEGILDLPEWFINTAIQNWVPEMPVESFALTPFMTITLISIVLIILGYIGYRRRDLIEGT